MKRTLIIVTIVALTTTLWAVPLYAQSSTTTHNHTETTVEPAFGDNEQLTFVVSYRAALMPNLEAGQVVIKVSEATINSESVYNISANGRVFQHFKWVYDLNDTYQSWLNKTTLRPVKFEYRLREGNYRVNSHYVYDWDKMRVTTNFHNLKRDPNTPKVMTLTENSYDAIALFYNLRAEEIENYKIGEVRKLEMVLEDTIRVIKYKYMGKEKKTIKKLGTFNTIKISCSIATSSGESFDDGSEFFIWITDDKNKIPLQFESPIKVGSVRATLTKYLNLRHPLTSKIK